MRKPKPKFRIGDSVFDSHDESNRTILRIHFDPCDGWLYDVGDHPRWRFEEDLEVAD